VDELDRDAGRDRRLLGTGGRGEEAEERTQPLAAGGERSAGDLRGEPRPPPHRLGQPHLELAEITGEAGRRVDDRELRHPATPVWSATIEPPRRRYATSAKPAARRRAA